MRACGTGAPTRSITSRPSFPQSTMSWRIAIFTTANRGRKGLFLHHDDANPTHRSAGEDPQDPQFQDQNTAVFRGQIPPVCHESLFGIACGSFLLHRFRTIWIGNRLCEPSPFVSRAIQPSAGIPFHLHFPCLSQMETRRIDVLDTRPIGFQSDAGRAGTLQILSVTVGLGIPGI
jgi:hypothetical protein